MRCIVYVNASEDTQNNPEDTHIEIQETSFIYTKQK